MTDPETDPDPAFAAELDELALIEARGADAEAFLQGQLSSDVRRLGADRAQLSSFNSPKGRVLAVLTLVRAGDALLLELRREILESVLKRLRLYVLRSKVTLAEAGGHVLLGLLGARAGAVLAQLGLPAPAAPLACTWVGGIGVLRRLGGHPRYSLLVPAARAAALRAALASLARPAPPGAWRRADIEAGVPAVFPQTQDRFVAQMCNLDALGAVSFDKGCYTGQEVIARVHYRGAVKRHMTPLLTPQAGLAPGATLTLPDGRNVEVVDAAPDPGGGSIALVVAPDA